MPARRRRTGTTYYDPDSLVDAPEHHAYSRAMGVLTWGTWDHTIRPVEQRVRDFRQTFPPEAPEHFMQRSYPRHSDETAARATREALVARFLATDGRAGSLLELLARYGLKVPTGPGFEMSPFVAAPLREIARQRNLKLRGLHGAVDIEASNMDEAKATLLVRQAKVRAAQEVRDALRTMDEELDRDG